MPETGKAAVFFGSGKPFEIKELPVPALEPGAVLARIALADVCGSDLHFWRGDAPLALPPDGWILQRSRSRYQFDRLVSHTFLLARINEALREAEWYHREGSSRITRAALAP